MRGYRLASQGPSIRRVKRKEALHTMVTSSAEWLALGTASIGVVGVLAELQSPRHIRASARKGNGFRIGRIKFNCGKERNCCGTFDMASNQGIQLVGPGICRRPPCLVDWESQGPCRPAVSETHSLRVAHHIAIERLALPGSRVYRNRQSTRPQRGVLSGLAA
jgi:hypothetical protein